MTHPCHNTAVLSPPCTKEPEMANVNTGMFLAHMSAMDEFKNALPSIEVVKEREEKFIRYTNELRALNGRQSVNLPSGCDTREEYLAFLSKELFFLRDQLETRFDMFEAWSDYIADLLDWGPGDGDLPSWVACHQGSRKPYFRQLS